MPALPNVRGKDAKILGSSYSPEGAFMPDVLQVPSPTPLTSFTEDEILFRDNIRQFADEKVRPLVKEMDEKGVFDKDLIHQFFQLGLMGIEIPEQYGGGGGKFFEAILAVEEMSRVDASAGVIVDVQNTLVNNALLRWATEEQKKRYLAAHGCGPVRRVRTERGGFGLGRVCAADESRAQGQRLRSQRTQVVDHERQRSGLFVLFATVDPAAGYKGITAFLIEKEFPGFTVGQERRQAGHPRFVHLRVDSGRLPRPQVQRSRRSGQGIQDRD